MGKDLYIQDVAKVYFKSKSTGNIVGVGYAQTAGFEITAEQTEIRGGIGNPVAYVIKSSKSINLTVTSATFKPEFIALTQGTTYVDGESVNAMDSFFAKVEADGADKIIKIPADLTSLALTTVRVEDTKGKQTDLAVTAGEVELTQGVTASVGDELEVFYLKPMTGRKIDFRADSYSEKLQVEFTTPAYDRETETIAHDMFIVFHEASPSTNFALTLQAGEALIPELTFIVTAPKGSSVLGSMYEIPRVLGN